jgi:enoyl-[acyl-carrier protein] reductase I
MGMLDGKTGIVFGVANKRSIAWAIAQSLAKEGMRLAFTYQGDRLKENVEELTSTLTNTLLLPCDVTNDSEVEAVYAAVGQEFGKLDALSRTRRARTSRMTSSTRRATGSRSRMTFRHSHWSR